MMGGKSVSGGLEGYLNCRGSFAPSGGGLESVDAGRVSASQFPHAPAVSCSRHPCRARGPHRTLDTVPTGPCVQV